MYLASLTDPAGDIPVAVDPARGVVDLWSLFPGRPGDVMAALDELPQEEFGGLVRGLPDTEFRPLDEAALTAPYRRPRKIWGIGLNYVEHAADLSEATPEEPASFLKADHTVIGPGDPVPLPAQSQKVTAEAELGLVIGRTARSVRVEDALDYVWGLVPVLDQTAEDILARNPRFLTRAKNFPGFFSFGPGVVPLAEVLGTGDGLAERLAALEVSTVLGGKVRRTNTVSNMRYDPAFLVAFHSEVMPLYPGDIISTGTPGAVQVRPGDVAECRIPGVGRLVNPVVAGDPSR